MPEYIEREKLIEELNKMPAYFDSNDIRYGVKIAIDQVKKQPTADIVEVVRCKSCKFSEWSNKNKQRYCTRKWAMYKVRERDYCSYGKKYEF